jgi:hypothetical protein
VRLIVSVLSALIIISPVSALTLFNSRDAKTQSASSKAAGQLNSAFSKMFEALAVVERRSFDEADKIKQDSVKLFQDSAKLFSEVAQEASNDKVVPDPRDDEDKRTIQRMTELSKSYGVAYNEFGEFSERRLFGQLGKILLDFATELDKLPSAAFAKEFKEQRLASQFLLHAIRLQDFGRVVTAYLSIPRKR